MGTDRRSKFFRDLFDSDRYWQEGENWRDFVSEGKTLKLVKPIHVISEDEHGNFTYYYKCEGCFEMFSQKREIHIPLCPDCRLKDIDEIRKR